MKSNISWPRQERPREMEEVKEHVRAQKEIQGLWYQEVHGHVHWTREVVSDLRER